MVRGSSVKDEGAVPLVKWGGEGEGLTSGCGSVVGR